MALKEKSETFLIYLTTVKALQAVMSIDIDKKALIIILLTKKIMILDKYSDFALVFLEKKILILPKQTKLNKYVIELEASKQLL